MKKAGLGQKKLAWARKKLAWARKELAWAQKELEPGHVTPPCFLTPVMLFGPAYNIEGLSEPILVTTDKPRGCENAYFIRFPARLLNLSFGYGVTKDLHSA